MNDEIYELIDKVEQKYGEDSDEATDANDTFSQAMSELRQLKADLNALLKPTHKD